MKNLKGNCIIGQSGGPSSVINSSVLGAMKAALQSKEIETVYGAANGIKGVLNDKLYIINKEDEAELDKLRFTPSSALGSCRYKLKNADVDDTDYKRILEVFKKHNIRYFFYTGGNDSMDTCNKVSKYLLSQGYECNVIGIPKTIDNDLDATDHCPGYGSSAKYIATTIMEISLDSRVYDYGTITIVEIMGRNAGWLTAASTLANLKGLGPDLVYLPEVPMDLDEFVSTVEKTYNNLGRCLVAISEGVMDKNGVYISQYGSSLANEKDSFGHAQMGGLASFLASVCKERIGAKVRGIELSLSQRCAAHCASKTDYDEAFNCGYQAVLAAINGATDMMAAYKCDRANGYKCGIEMVPLTKVANVEKKVPLSWIMEDNTGLTDDYINYALPLIQGETELAYSDGLPDFAFLNKILEK